MTTAYEICQALWMAGWFYTSQILWSVCCMGLILVNNLTLILAVEIAANYGRKSNG